MNTISFQDAWVTNPRPNDRARLRLFCLPYAGGGASIYRGWAEALAPAIEVRPIQLPGREGRRAEPSFTRLPDLVAALAPALEPHLGGPWALFGHSMGALVAFELARALRRRGHAPTHLFAAAFRAPHLPDPDPPIHDLDEPRFLAAVGRLNGTPAEILDNAELMALLSPILRADFTLCETYAYRPELPLDCPITVFGGLADDAPGYDQLVPWAMHTVAPFRLEIFPGDHFFVQSARQQVLRAVARHLRPALDAPLEALCA